MIELKRQVNETARKAGVAPPYDPVLVEGESAKPGCLGSTAGALSGGVAWGTASLAAERDELPGQTRAVRTGLGQFQTESVARRVVDPHRQRTFRCLPGQSPSADSTSANSASMSRGFTK